MNTELETRVERAVERLAHAITPDVAAARRAVEARRAGRRRQRSTQLVALAAALLVVVGAGGVWLAQRGDAPATGDGTVAATTAPTVDDGPAPVTDTGTRAAEGQPAETRPLSPVGSPPPTAATDGEVLEPPFTEPANVAILDPATLANPRRGDPWDEWLFADRPQPRQFVRYDGTLAVGALVVIHDTGSEWFKTYDHAAPIELGDVEGRQVVGDDSGSVAFEVTDGSMIVSWRGTTTMAEAVALATELSTSTPAELELPAGYVDVAPIVVVPTSYPDSWDVPNRAVNVALSSSADGAALDASTVALLAGSPVTEGVDGVADAWLVDAPWGRGAVRQLDAATVVSVYADDDSGVDPATAIAGVRLVPASDVALASAETAINPPFTAVRAFGVVDEGRWYVASWMDAGRECTVMSASFGGSGWCDVPRSTPPCFVSVGGGPDIGWSYSVLVEGTPSEISVSFDGGAATTGTLQRTGDATSGGTYTFVSGSAPEAVEAVEVLIDGEPTC